MCYRGCIFDSILELKFVLSIEKKFHFLRAHIPIWYDPKNFEPTYNLTDSTKTYTPDFLVRDKINGNASLVEIKPANLKCSGQSTVRTAVAERFIQKYNYDWKFVILCDDEILLNEEQQKKFDMLKNHKHSFADILKFQQMDRKFNNTSLKYSKTVPSHEEFTPDEYIRLVKYGNTSFHIG